MLIVLRSHPGDALALSPNKCRNQHWSKQAELIRNWRTNAKLTYLDARAPSFTMKVRLSFIVCRKRRVDHAQLHGSRALKSLEDGFVDAGMVPDDSPDWVEWGFVAPHFGWEGQPCVTVLIETIGDLDV